MSHLLSHPADDPHESNTSKTLGPAATARCTAPILTPPGATQTGTAEDPLVWDGRRCRTPAVLHVSIDHDGRTCGCGGMCLAAPEDAGTPPVAAWTEVLLLCAEHTAIYCAASEGQFPPSATIADLTGHASIDTGSREAQS